MLCNNVFTLQTFAKFRCGVAPLRLETGSYERLSPEQITCFYCTDCIESEEHVLLSCPVYDDLRLIVESVIKSGYAEYDSLTNRDKRHFSLLNVNAAGACGYDFLCDGGRLVRAYVRLRRGAIRRITQSKLPTAQRRRIK